MFGRDNLIEDIRITARNNGGNLELWVNNPDSVAYSGLYYSAPVTEIKSLTIRGGTIRKEVNGESKTFYDNETVWLQGDLGIKKIEIVGRFGDDKLILDFANGNPILGADVTFHGGDGENEIHANADANYNLSDDRLIIAGKETVVLTNVSNATLIAGVSDNTFTVSDWTGFADIIGNAGTDKIVSANDANFSLTGERLTCSTGGNFALSSIEQAFLTGGAGSNSFSVNGWSGAAKLDGGAGSDAISIVSNNDANYFLSNTRTDDDPTGSNFFLSSFEQATISAGAGADTFSLIDWTGSATLAGGAGADTFSLINWTGSALIDGGADTDIVNIFNDQNGSMTLGLTNVEVLQIGSGTVNLQGIVSLDTLNLSGGTLNVAGKFILNGISNWNGGTLAGFGLAVNLGQLEISGDADKTLSLRTFRNAGIVNWTGDGRVLMENGNLLDNLGTFNAFNNSDFSVFDGSAPVFRNEGTFRKANSFLTTAFADVAFVNDGGMVLVDSGTLLISGVQLANGEGVTSTGTFDLRDGTLRFSVVNPYTLNAAVIGAAGTVEFAVGTVNVGGSYNVGVTKISGGKVNFTTDASTDILDQSAGLLTGPNTVTVALQMTWSGGTMSGTGVTRSDTLLLINGLAAKTLDSRLLINAGLAGWSDLGAIILAEGAVIDNEGAFIVHNDAEIKRGLVIDDAPAFNNSGIFSKLDGAGITIIGVAVNNIGLFDLQTGTIRIDGLYTQTAGITNVGNDTTLDNRHPLLIQGGTLAGDGTITGEVIMRARIAPGDSPGILTILGNYEQAATGVYAVELGGSSPGFGYDQIAVGGNVKLDGTLEVSVLPGFTDGSFTIIDNVGFSPVEGTFAGLAEGASFTVEGHTFQITYAGGDGNDVVLTSANEPPVLHVPAAVSTVTNVPSAFTGENAISFTDDDSLGLFTLTLSATNGTLAITDLNFSAAVSGNDSALLRIFSSTPTAINDVLATLTFSPTTGFQGLAGMTITIEEFAGATVLSDTEAIDINVANDAPVNHVPTTTQVTLQNVPLVFSSANGNPISVSDGSIGTFYVTTLTVTNGTLSFTDPNYRQRFGDHSSTIEISFGLDIGNQILNGLTFTPTSTFTGDAVLTVRTEEFVFVGGLPSTLAADSDTVSITITVAATTTTVATEFNPVLYGDTIVFTAHTTSTAELPIAGWDTFTVQPVVRAFGSSGTGVTSGPITVDGNGDASFTPFFPLLPNNYQVTVTFQPNIPFAGSTSDVLNFTVLAETDVLAIRAPDALIVGVNQTLPFIGENALAISYRDPSGADPTLSVSLTAANGTLAFGDSFNLTFTPGSSPEAMTFTGTLYYINVALSTLTFTPAPDFTGPASLTISAGDPRFPDSPLTNDTDTVLILVANPNTAPTITVPGSQTIVENTAFTFSGLNSIFVTDADAGSNPISLSLATTFGSLTLGSTAGLIFTSGGNGSSAMTVTGTLFDVNAALGGMTFVPDDFFVGTTAVAILVDDLGTGLGGALTAENVVFITVNPAEHLETATALEPVPSIVFGYRPITFIAHSTTREGIIPAGTNTFLITNLADGSVITQDVALDETGSASLTLPAGIAVFDAVTYSITVVYNGTEMFGSSTATQQFFVSLDGTTTTLNGPTTVDADQSFTIFAQTASFSGLAVIPSSSTVSR